MIFVLLQICASLAPVVARFTGQLDGLLKDYETLDRQDVIASHVAKRSADLQSIYRSEHIISFSSFGRSFRLRLYRQEGLFSNSIFAAEIGRNLTRQIHLDESEFFAGFLDGESRDFKTFAYWENDNLVAVIRTRNDTYFIEPSWRHFPETTNYTMIVYRLSDIRRIYPEMFDNQVAFCNPPEVNNSGASPLDESRQSSSQKFGNGTRMKRDSGDPSSHSMCSVMLIADYHFFETVGGSSVSNTVKYMIGVLTRVHSIYMNTDFGLNFGQLGFQIEGILVHTGPSNDSYNKQTTSWSSSDLLNAFSSNSDWEKYCLVHLFTSTAFDNGVLGLAWVASSQSGSLGGICSKCSGGKCYNTGWSTSLNKFNNRLVVLEADLVTAHELGHGWGAQHDPDRSECSPSTSNNGKYIMYPFSVSGRDPNNNQFSPCSRTSISKVLQAKIETCFIAPRSGFCGNYKVEENEQCDAGPDGKTGGDKCCDNKCQFIGNSICSDANSDCCENCTYAPQTKRCWSASVDSDSCRNDSYCTGSNVTCPTTFLRDGSPCLNNGHCRGGVCQNVCEFSNLTSCVCDDVANSCLWCCKDSLNGTCQPKFMDATGSFVNVSDGYPCKQGYCQSGICQKSIQTTTNRAWDFIQQLSANQIRIFFRNNLVLATVILSLIPYLIFCVVICYLDRKKHQKASLRNTWLHRDNDRLILNENLSNMRRIDGVIHRRLPSSSERH